MSERFICYDSPSGDAVFAKVAGESKVNTVSGEKDVFLVSSMYLYRGERVESVHASSGTHKIIHKDSIGNGSIYTVEELGGSVEDVMGKIDDEDLFLAVLAGEIDRIFPKRSFRIAFESMGGDSGMDAWKKELEKRMENE